MLHHAGGQHGLEHIRALPSRGGPLRRILVIDRL
jgi:hypothetical protein